jgi:hypothetical protein
MTVYIQDILWSDNNYISDCILRGRGGGGGGGSGHSVRPHLSNI